MTAAIESRGLLFAPIGGFLARGEDRPRPLALEDCLVGLGHSFTLTTRHCSSLSLGYTPDEELRHGSKISALVCYFTYIPIRKPTD